MSLQVRTKMANSLFRVEQFKPSLYDANQVRSKWKEWRDHVESVMRANQVSDPDIKKEHLKAYGGPEVQQLIKNIPGMIRKGYGSLW